jgi:glucosamine--fructose-6-phosphate aminotransferase (isomerizing)
MNPPAEVPTRMFLEAGQAGAAVATQLDKNREQFGRVGDALRRLAPTVVLTCGRGSSDHAATFAKYLIETKTGVPTASVGLSVSSVYGSLLKAERSFCLAISQSGRSPDLLSGVEKARAGGAYVVVLVNDVASPLAQMADEVLPLHAGPELSVAATKSYIAALAGIAGLVAEWAEDEMLASALRAAPELLDRAWSLDWSPLAEHLADATNLYVIGRGMGLGIAQEAALKLKETCGLHAEAFSAAEVRHGPMALVTKGFPIIVFRQQDETGAGVDDLLQELIARGANVLVAGSAPEGAVALPTVGAHPVLEPVLQIQSFYRAANALSLARGYDPDRPPHLAKVTRTL